MGGYLFSRLKVGKVKIGGFRCWRVRDSARELHDGNFASPLHPLFRDWVSGRALRKRRDAVYHAPQVRNCYRAGGVCRGELWGIAADSAGSEAGVGAEVIV